MNSRIARACAGLTAGVAVAAVLTACGGGSEESGTPSIVASTDVWGSVASAVAGPDAQVSAIITDPAADPHSFETSATDTAKISDAELVVFNGGHYDEFIEQAISGKDKRTVEAFEERTDKSDENEHVWYDVTTVAAVADRIAAELGEIDAPHKDAYTERAVAFKNQLMGISTITGAIAAQTPNAAVAQSEPLAHYLLLAAKAQDKTPHEFQEAIEQETDPSPAAVAATRDLITGKQVKALIYNTQTQDKVTQDLRAAAQAAGVTVVEVTETLPEGVDYVQWQTANAKALAAALR
ncbi:MULTISPECIES: metal ABC transporter solute-binding protein, Zn/Mn family [Nocardia]|uniref:metal ABC transporter solute-binding protein, Zn/Mn family n=1 Tax=Nocardia TaxID=1817 RepID=UPI001CD99D9F|nr:zinc ABC transporter substrate-binding protein [Nocardia rosealba]MCA2209447.1 zinc ABC transporter substrate-binding protein [Nocardia rosealba]